MQNKLEELLATTTPLPWRIGNAGQTLFGPPTGEPSPRTVATLPKPSAPCPVSRIEENIANGQLIAHAVNMLPKLVDALRAAHDFLNAVLGRDTFEAMDLLTNNGEDANDRIYSALLEAENPNL